MKDTPAYKRPPPGATAWSQFDNTDPGILADSGIVPATESLWLSSEIEARKLIALVRRIPKMKQGGPA